MSKESKTLITRNEMLAVYQSQPKLLASELDWIFGESHKEADFAVHNYIVGKIAALCENRERMLSNVAKAIIASSTE